MQCVLVIMYKSITGMLLDALNNMFTIKNSIHTRVTRQTNTFCILQITSKVIRHDGVLLWNNLPDDNH